MNLENSCNKSNWSIGVKSSRDREKILSEEKYSLDETINLLKNLDFTKYLGSGKQRKLIKDDLKLFTSILEYSSILSNTKNVNLRARIQYLLEKPKINCECGKYSIYDNVNFNFTKYCKYCSPKFNSKEYFKSKNEDNFEEKYEENKKRLSEQNKGFFTLEWFKSKFKEKGEEKYTEHYTKIFDNRKNMSYSKISQKLFWKIFEKIKDKENVFFEELNKEKHINLNKDDKLIYGDDKKVRINLDFVYRNKVIEFNGEYWHSSQKSRQIDLNRKKICESKGFDVLFVWEKEFKESEEEVINRCLRFLVEDTKINDRYMIKTLNGYETFDNIISKGKMKTLLFKTSNNFIEVSFKHKFVINNQEVIAEELKIGDYLETINGLEPIITIEEKEEKEVFDILNTNSHTFLANNINNHNCSFLGSSHTLISSEKLANMAQLPIQETRDGKLKIYEYPQKGHKYIFAVDPAKDGRDAFACQIVDITDFTFKQVAAAQIQIDYLLMPEFIFEWAEMYNNAYLIIENNEGAGQSIADQLYKDYEYENLHFDKDSQSNKRKKYPGFRTTTRSRKLILQTLKLFIENDRLNICDASTMNEFLTFILVNNKYQADDGSHDDMIMSLALIFVPFCNARNFEDMKDLIKNLYKVDIEEDSEDTDKKDKKKTFTEHMMIGDFADYGEIEMPAQQSYSWNGFIVEYGSE